MKYYTYIYYYEDGTAYYVGKGVGNRCLERRRHSVPIPEKQFIQKFHFDTEVEAWDTEIQLIALYGRQQDGGSLMNLSTGGQFATTGVVFSEDTIARRATACKEHFKHNEHPRARPYRVIKPDGTTVDIVGIRKYCRENNLSHPAMCAVARGKADQHKGHKCIRL